MTLPVSRNRTYTAVDPVASADLDDIQDMIIGARHGSIIIAHQVMNGYAAQGSPALSGSQWLSTTSSDRVEVGLTLPVGTVIEKIEAFVNQSGATPITWELRYADNTGASAALETHAGNATLGAKTLPKTMSQTIVAGRTYFFRWDAAIGAEKLNLLELTIRK